MAVTPHAKSLLDLKERAQVAYAYSPSPQRRAGFAERFSFPQCDRLETILEDRSVDAVLVLTPPNTHLELVERCAAAGKHVLLEKPLEVSTAKAERLVKACENVKLGVVLQHRFRPAAEKLHELLPRLGKLVSASVAIPNWRPQSYYDQPGRGTRARDGGGVLLTQGIHTLDLFLSYTGEPAEVKSFVTTTPVHRMETEDLVAAAVRFRSGALGVVHATTAAYPGFPERIELIGTQGTALLEGTSLKMSFADGQGYELKTESGAGGTGADPMAFPHDWHRGVLEDFLDSIEENREPRASGAEALKVHRFIDRILQSAG
jgi:predicted dehydrogenase